MLVSHCPGDLHSILHSAPHHLSSRSPDHCFRKRANQRDTLYCKADSGKNVQEQRAALKTEPVKYGRDGIIPQKILSKTTQERGQKLTVYTLRFTTATSRGSSLDEPNAAVQICLVNEEGQAVLQRIPPIQDAKSMQAELDAVSKAMDQGRLRNTRRPSELTSYPDNKPRFQSGNIDELSFLGPELGPIKSVLVSPENGSWRLSEVTVVSSQSQRTDRFLCDRLLGAKEGAAFLTPVPEHGVVYGSGESAAIITRAEARALHEAGMGKYSLFKERLFQTNITLVGLGTGLGWTFCGDEVALEFGSGGLAGLAYMWLLQTGVDRIGLRSSPPKKETAGAGEAFLRLVSSGGFRFVSLVGFAVACAIYGTHARELSPQHSTASLTQAQQLLVGVAGFLMYKVATVSVLTFPPIAQLDEHK